METDIRPEPTDAERRAILLAVASAEAVPGPYRSRWRETALDDLRGGDAAAEDPRGDARIVEP